MQDIHDLLRAIGGPKLSWENRRNLLAIIGTLLLQ
jgi:hypothetical protein